MNIDLSLRNSAITSSVFYPFNIDKKSAAQIMRLGNIVKHIDNK